MFSHNIEKKTEKQTIYSRVELEMGLSCTAQAKYANWVYDPSYGVRKG